MTKKDVKKHFIEYFALDKLPITMNDELMIDWGFKLIKECNKKKFKS